MNNNTITAKELCVLARENTEVYSVLLKAHRAVTRMMRYKNIVTADDYFGNPERVFERRQEASLNYDASIKRAISLMRKLSSVVCKVYNANKPSKSYLFGVINTEEDCLYEFEKLMLAVNMLITSQAMGY